MSEKHTLETRLNSWLRLGRGCCCSFQSAAAVTPHRVQFRRTLFVVWCVEWSTIEGEYVPNLFRSQKGVTISLNKHSSSMSRISEWI